MHALRVFANPVSTGPCCITEYIASCACCRDAGVKMPPNLGGTYPELPADLQTSQMELTQMELQEPAGTQPQQQQEAAAAAMEH